MLVAEYKLVLKSGNLNNLYDALVNNKLDALVIDGGITKKYVNSYLSNKRDSLCKYTISVENEDPVVLEFVAASKEDAKFLLEMFKTKEIDEVPMNPIPIEFIEAFLKGERDNIISLKIGKLEEEETLGEEA